MLHPLTTLIIVLLMFFSILPIGVGIETLIKGYNRLNKMSKDEKVNCGTFEVLQMMYGIIWLLLPMFFWFVIYFLNPQIFTKDLWRSFLMLRAILIGPH